MQDIATFFFFFLRGDDMLISDNLECDNVIKEFAIRFKQHRISARITQKELAKKTGISLRTISRFEKGEEIGLLTFAKLLQGVGLEHNLENIIPDHTKRPSYFVSGGKLPKRAKKKEMTNNEWKWGDEK